MTKKTSSDCSIPVTKILHAVDSNIPFPTPSSKKTVKSFLQGTPLKRYKQTPPRELQPTPTLTKSITKLSTPAQHFKIYRDNSTPKTPVSELKHTTSWKQPSKPLETSANQQSTPTTRKITRETVSGDFKVRSSASYSPFLIPQSLADSQMLHEIEMPMVKLDQWYKINQVEILTKEPLEDAYTVIVCSAFNDMLTLVTLEATDGGVSEVLLLNYKQSIATLNKFQNIKKGDRVQLIEGFDILGEWKLYHSWKLQV